MDDTVVKNKNKKLEDRKVLATLIWIDRCHKSINAYSHTKPAARSYKPNKIGASCLGQSMC